MCCWLMLMIRRPRRIFTVWRSELMDGNTGYTAIQLSDSAVRTEVLKLEPKYDDIVIDTGGRDTASQRAALTIANVFLLPFIPRSFDIWTLEKVTALIEEIQPINPEFRDLGVSESVRSSRQ